MSIQAAAAQNSLIHHSRSSDRNGQMLPTMLQQLSALHGNPVRSFSSFLSIPTQTSVTGSSTHTTGNFGLMNYSEIAEIWEFEIGIIKIQLKETSLAVRHAVYTKLKTSGDMLPAGVAGTILTIRTRKNLNYKYPRTASLSK